MQLLQRPRRLRASPQIRDICKETRLHPDDFMLPLFIKAGKNIKNPIESMPGHYQVSVDNLDAELEEIAKLGIRSVMLFGIPEYKDRTGSDSLHDNGVVQQAIRYIKKRLPDLLVAADVCFCEYTDHGHCGIIKNNDLDNDATLEILAKQAVSFAKAGVDVVAPSGMIDGMVLAIRDTLDNAGYNNVVILSHAVKYCSSMYGPFRFAAHCAPKFGDRKTYQADFANSNESLKEVSMDIEEGADIIMIKPAHTYLDIIHKVKTNFPEVTVAAYHPSGEFAMIKAAAEKGWIDERAAILEVTTAIKRAGANLIISYFTKDLINALKSGVFK